MSLRVADADESSILNGGSGGCYGLSEISTRQWEKTGNGRYRSLLRLEITRQAVGEQQSRLFIEQRQVMGCRAHVRPIPESCRVWGLTRKR